jgi:hypothetical protein
MAITEFSSKLTKTGTQVKKVYKDGGVDTTSTYELDKHGNWVLIRKETKESKD